MATDRLISPATSADENALEGVIRPRRLADYIGQPVVHEQMEIFIGAARKRGEALDHVLIFGPPGLGKTTLAHIVANEMGVNLRQTSGPVLERPGDLAALLTNLEPRDVLFIDEIHRLSPVVEEILYPAMEDFQLDIMIGEGPAARALKLEPEWKVYDDLDGVYDANVEPPRRKPRLRRARAPTSAQLTQLANTIAHRVCRHLSRRGWLEGEDESVFLSDSAGSDDGMDGLRMSSMTYRIATGRDAGRKVVTLQTLPGDAGSLEGDAGKVGGFSLHAGVAAEAHESHKLEKLCRYITRPAISEQRLSISPQGRVRYQLKTPWRNGTTHVEWDAVDFIAKLAALVPPPRAHLTRFHGVFAPNANLRAQLTPSGRGKRPAGDAAPVDVSAHDAPRSPEEKRRAMSWAQRLKRVFSIDVTACVHCGGTVRIVASIEEPTAIRAILAHFEKHGAREEAHYRPAARAPPVQAA